MKRHLINLYFLALFTFTTYVGGWLMVIEPMSRLIGRTSIQWKEALEIVLSVLFALPTSISIYLVGVVIAILLFTKKEDYKGD